MQFPCPSCQATISANFAKPGKYQPKCPKCGAPFQVLIHVSIPGASGGVPVPKPRHEPEKSQALAPPAPSKVTTSKPTVPPRLDPDATFDSGFKEDSSEEFARYAHQDIDATSATGMSSEQDNSSEQTAAFENPDVAPRARSAMQSDDTEVTGDFQPEHPAAEDLAEDRDQTAVLSPEQGGISSASRAESPPNDDANATTDFGTQSPPPKASTKKRPSTAKSPQAEADEFDLPDELGGYEILKQLGKGGMGAVYLARQVSLDRPVALKVMSEKIASDARFVARFVREAYAAAQLTHHNVVQIYDIGTENGINFFSMEFVRGGSLGDVLKKQGKLPHEEAVSYIMQAARGLKFAHERGMVHRDIKPDNLMLNTDGIVKVADMGLIKTRDMKSADDEGGGRSGSVLSELPDVTSVGSAMGSPSYMAPEQCRDAASVDHRADIYSLGCTLYALVSGRTPFQGKTAIEVITKHLNEPPPPIQTVVKDIPKSLAEIINRTLRKEPSERYQSMEELLQSLKDWQETSKSGPPKPTEEQLLLFEGIMKKLGQSSSERVGSRVALFGPIAGIALATLTLLTVSPVTGLAIAFVTMGACVSGLITSGLFSNSYLFQKIRSWVLGARIYDWLMVGLGGVLALVVLALAGLFWSSLLSLGIGALLGVGYGFLFVKPAVASRLDLKDDLESVLKRLRLAGMDEDAVRAFVIETAADRWEDVYETLFGYEAKIQARTLYAEKTINRPKFMAWRDSLIQKIDRLLADREKARAEKMLRAVEAARLKAEGVNPEEAEARARDAAEDLVEQAEEIRAANLDKKRKVNVQQMMTRYEKARLERPKRKRPNVIVQSLKGILLLPLDPRVRGLIGALLLVAGLLWIRQEAAAVVPKPGTTMTLLEKIEPSIQAGSGQPLKFSYFPVPEVILQLFNSANALLAGAIFLVSAFAQRSFALVLTLAGGVFAFVGHRVGLPFPDDLYGFKPSHLAGSLGVTVALFAMIVLGSGGGRGRDVPDDDDE